MNVLLPLIVLLGVACATGAGDVPSRAAASDATPPDVASGPVTESQLEFRTRLRNVLRGTQSVKETLVVARDPRSGVALWYSTPRPDPIAAFLASEGGGTDTAKVLATPDRMVRFVALGAPLTIAVHESTHTFSSVEEAEHVIAAAVDDGTASSLRTRGAAVELPEEHYRYLIPLDAPGSRIPQLRDARFGNGQWLITLYGPSSFRALFVTLDSDYRLLEVKKDR